MLQLHGYKEYIILFFLLHICPFAVHAMRRSCSSPIYCEGELLHLVQTAKIFNDSKTFVDMAMKYPMNTTLQNFDVFMRKTDHKPTTKQIEEFVYENFQMVGEMEDFFPRDWKPEPKFVKEINDPQIRQVNKLIIFLFVLAPHLAYYNINI